jgi:hypothetical protein
MLLTSQVNAIIQMLKSGTRQAPGLGYRRCKPAPRLAETPRPNPSPWPGKGAEAIHQSSIAGR